jgi:hypothetical protein
MNQPNVLLENKHVGNLTKDNTLKTNPFSFYLFFFSFLFHYYAYHTLFPHSPFFLSPTANMPHLLFLFLILLPASFSQMYSFLHFQLLLFLHCELQPSSFMFFFFFNRGWWFGHPLRPWGWLGHPQTGFSTANSSLLLSPFFFFFFNRGWWFGHPLRPWGWPRPAGLGVAEPPPWPKGWPATPLRVDRPPLFFFFLFFVFLFFFFNFFNF